MIEVEFQTEDSGIIAVYNEPAVPDVGEPVHLFGKGFYVVQRGWRVRKDAFVEGVLVTVTVIVAPIQHERGIT